MSDLAFLPISRPATSARAFFETLIERLDGDYAAVATLWVLLFRQADLAPIPTSKRDIEAFSNGCVSKNTAARALDRLVAIGAAVLTKHPNTTTEVRVNPSAIISLAGRFGPMNNGRSLAQNVPEESSQDTPDSRCTPEVAARLQGDFAAARVLEVLQKFGALDGYITLSRAKLAEQVRPTVTERASRLATDRLAVMGLIERRTTPNMKTELRINCEALRALLAQPLPSSAVLPGITPLDDALVRIFGQHSQTTEEGETSNGEI